MGSGKGGGVPSNVSDAQAGLANQLTSLMSQEQGQSQQLFNLSMPGLEQATQWYQSLASGSPTAIATAISPATQQIAQQSTGAIQNILQNTPAGGERNLALQQVDVNRGAQVGSLATQGYTSAFPALAQLGGHGISLGQGAAGTAVSAGQAAGQQWGNIAQQDIEQKGASLGAFGGLTSSLFGAAGAAGGFGKLFA